jgi:hypothetical protein
MAQATGLMLFAGSVSFGNEWLQTGTPNFRIPVATLASTLFLNGVEKLYPKAAVGLATIIVITVMVTPLHGKSPLQTAVDVLPKPK